MNAIPLTVTTVLFGAAELLRSRSWGTMMMESPDLRTFCVVGAISRVVADAGIDDPVVHDNLATDAINQLTRTIWEATGDSGRPHATAWNDRSCKSKEEAIAMLELAAGAVRG